MQTCHLMGREISSKPKIDENSRELKLNPWAVLTEFRAQLKTIYSMVCLAKQQCHQVMRKTTGNVARINKRTLLSQ